MPIFTGSRDGGARGRGIPEHREGLQVRPTAFVKGRRFLVSVFRFSRTNARQNRNIMDDRPSDPDPTDADPFSSAPADGGMESPSGSAASSLDTDPAFLMNMAKMWIQEHQRSTMLGAFAVGVFVGSLFRK